MFYSLKADMQKFLYLQDRFFFFTVIILVLLAAVLAFRKASQLILFKSWILKVALSIFTIAVTLFSLLILAVSREVMVVEKCNQQVAGAFNQINAHITELCVLREDSSQCPQNESEIQAYNQDLFDEITSCTNTQFVTNDLAVWAVRLNKRNSVLVSGIDDPVGFAVMTYDEAVAKNVWRE